MSVNKVILVGRLGNDPEVRSISNGSVNASFSIATSESWVDKGGSRQKKTEWHRVVVWGKLAHSCGQYLAKGSMAYVEGKIHTRSYQDKQGQEKVVTEILAANIQFLSQRKGADTNVVSEASVSRKTNSPRQENWSPDEYPQF